MPTTPVPKIELVTALHRSLNEFRKIANDDTGPDLDVRLCVDIGDQNWWLATGDVQYDTVHGDLCAAGTLWVTMTHEEVVEVATELMTEIDEQEFEHAPDCPACAASADT